MAVGQSEEGLGLRPPCPLLCLFPSVLFKGKKQESGAVCAGPEPGAARAGQGQGCQLPQDPTPRP